MDSGAAPTRQQLLQLRSQHDVIRKGLDLLKSKREALMKEFFGIVEESMELREKLTELLSAAQRDLQRVRAFSEPELLSFANSARRKLSFDIKLKNIWGVNVPEIEDKPLVRTLEARSVSPVGEKAAVIDVARKFESAAELIVRIASKETRLSRVGEMIKADTRKINAISEMMLPSMARRIKVISGVLEEREREEVFRLKRFKSKKAAEAAV